MSQYQGNIISDQQTSVFDRTNTVLHRLKSQTPAYNVNRRKIKKIQARVKNKVSYAYKERFTGIYNEMNRNGNLKRENSWEKFINPDRVGVENYMQRALNSEF